MNVTEFSNEFDIMYDNIASKGAPGLDLYEKSVYLTKAQLELVKNYYDPKSNRKQTGFENTEKRRTDLKELIRDNKTSLMISSNDGISTQSQFFRIPSDVFIIIQEQATITGSCFDKSQINVIPKTHDEYNIQIKNPFKRPNSNNIWRMDYYSHVGGTRNVELISEYHITQYHMRYIKYPSPIILINLNQGDFIGMDLTIDNKIEEQTCKLNQEIHREILDRAVELATVDYKENNLQNKIQTSSRNE